MDRPSSLTESPSRSSRRSSKSPRLASTLVPKVAGLKLEQVMLDGIDVQHITLTLRMTTSTSTCPDCHKPTSRVHSHYTRTLADLPWGSFIVDIHLYVRKFFCAFGACTKRIFTERLPDLVAPYARRTDRLGDILRLVGLAVGGRAGSRLVDRLQMYVSFSTMLRLIRRTPERQLPTPRVLGVDDFARRKGQVYGTILVDLEQHRPVDLLPDRTADTLIKWLQQHPGVEIISRDRSTEYTRGATQGAPHAIQVADRFHLLMNLREALERVLDRNRTRFRGIVIPKRVFASGAQVNSEGVLPTSAYRQPAQRSPAETVTRAARRLPNKERYQQVLHLHAEGRSIRGIARSLKMSRMTVYRYLRCDTDPTEARRHNVPSLLDPYLPYLHQRWTGGCCNGLQLWRELQAQGYPCSRKMVAVWVSQQRKLPGNTPAPTTPKKYLSKSSTGKAKYRKVASPSSSPPAPLPSTRRVAWFLLRDPEQLDMAEQAVLAQLQQACSEVAVAHKLVHGFLQMAKDRKSSGQIAMLDDWLAAASESNLPDMRAFAVGLEQDKAAVQAALTMEWSNGQTEGQVNRLKLRKRQLYGRANFDLLRQCVLNAV